MSILNDVKKVLGFDSTYTAFDTDIIMHINAAFGNVAQIGACDDQGFCITGATEDWDDLDIVDIPTMSLIKQYIYMKVKNVFDPPSSSMVIESNNNLIKELEWRLNVMTDSEE